MFQVNIIPLYDALPPSWRTAPPEASAQILMNAHEKIDILTVLLQKYGGQDEMFAEPDKESSRQKLFREDLRAVVSVIFKEEAKLHADMSIEEMKDAIKNAWEQTKPTEW